jgi:hypothetical protein
MTRFLDFKRIPPTEEQKTTTKCCIDFKAFEKINTLKTIV